MITTSTGAKKLESSDNWREIFPNPGTSAAGAHNASVDAQDRIQAEVAPIINGKRCSLGAASGEYVLLRNSTIAGKTDGAYKAAKAIPANTDLDSTYLGSPITGGLVNELNSKFVIKKMYLGGNSVPAGTFQIEKTHVPTSGYKAFAIAGFDLSRLSNMIYTGVFINEDVNNQIIIEGNNTSNDSQIVNGNIYVMEMKV